VDGAEQLHVDGRDSARLQVGCRWSTGRRGEGGEPEVVRLQIVPIASASFPSHLAMFFFPTEREVGA
jgi:hypothetical protein